MECKWSLKIIFFSCLYSRFTCKKVADICELLEVKQTSAYEIIGNLNKELEEQGYLTLRGKVPTKYFVKRFVVFLHGIVHTHSRNIPVVGQGFF